MKANNNQKLREALELCDKIMSDVVVGARDISPLEAFDEMGGIIDKALSAPPRNCDRRGIKNHTDALRAFCHEQSVKAFKIKPAKEWCLQYSRWLFAKAEGGAE